MSTGITTKLYSLLGGDGMRQKFNIYWIWIWR